MGALVDRQRAFQALHRAALAALETIGEAGTEGVPGGLLFAAMQVHGATLTQFNQLMDPMVQHGFLTRDGDCYSLTEAGQAFMVTLRGKTFCIEASVSNPERRQGHARANLADYTTTGSCSAVAQVAARYHALGYWVEVYNDRTKELVAGPFSPDEPFPSFVV